jgi:hypothetical protein
MLSFLIMEEKRFNYTVKLILLCVLAAALNFSLSSLLIYVFRVPLYLDTMFTAAVTFAVGVVPGLGTALLSYIAAIIKDGAINPFVFCMIAEVLIVWWLKPANINWKSVLPQEKPIMLVRVFARLMLLYVVACLTVSILGGLIAYIFYTVLPNTKHNFSAEDVVKIALLRSGLHDLALNIISRIPVNLIDRFIVILGGYGVSIFIRKWFAEKVGEQD